MTEADRVDLVLALLLAAAREQNMPVTGDQRVSEEHAARLAGLAPGSLKNLRGEGSAPPAFRLGVAGSRVSYRLFDLAAWIESRRGCC